MQRRFPILRKIILLAGDIGIVVASTYLAVSVVFLNLEFQPPVSSYYNMSPIMILATGVLFNINGLFSLARKRYSELLLSLAVAVFNLFIVMMAASFFFREFSYSRSVLVYTMGFQFFFLAIWKYVFWRVEKHLIQPKTGLLIGSKNECLSVLARLQVQPQLEYSIKYICTDCNSDWQGVADNIDLIIVCAEMPLKIKAEIVHFAHSKGKQVFLIPAVYEIFCSAVELDKIDDIPVLKPQYLKPSLEQRSLKRIFDIAVSLLALVCFLPIMLLAAIAVKIESSGPILYSQTRVGREEREFRVYKFRTMKPDAERMTGPVLASENDPRITKLGRFFRATRIDELPQLFNVLLGDMSIVGPRPERPFFVGQFKQEIPEYVYRHNVKPGITGWAQVYGKYNTTAYNKLIYDLIYIQKCNVLTDLVIILQTVRVLVTKSSTEGVNNQGFKNDLACFEIEQVG